MKNLKHIAIILVLFIQTLSFGQTSTLSTIKEKYTAKLAAENKGVGVLIKKDNNIESLQLGKFNLTENSVFNIGSATKTFTAILIMQEVEKGNLALTDSIGKYLNPIKNVDGSLTIATLLSHESGIDEVIGKNIQEMFYAKSDSIYNSLNLFNEIEKNHPENIGKFRYCNTNYLLLGQIIEKVTDQNYFDLLRTRIIEPLQLTHTYPYLYKNIPNLVKPYDEGKEVTDYLDYRYFAKVANSAGSIASTLSDMEKFYTSFFETNLLLKHETVLKMMQSGNNTYGLGLFKDTIDGKTYYGHGGNNIGYSFRNKYNPETKNLILYFSNTRSLPFNNDIQGDLLAYLNNEKVVLFKAVNPIFKQYEGKYLLKEANLVLEVKFEGDKMFLISEAQGVKSELFFKNETTVFDSVVGATLSVIADNDKALTFSQNGFSTTITKI